MIKWPRIVDRLIPFINDPRKRRYYRNWKHARPDEIKRKLDVCRVAILNGQDVARFTWKQDVLWRIDTRRQRGLERRGLLEEVTDWLRIPGILVACAVAVATIVWLFGLW